MKNISAQGDGGFTIIETMIVLAVMGFMFLIALQATNGKINQALFTQGVSELAATLQEQGQNVSDGNYNGIPLSCTASTVRGVSTVTATTSGGGTTQPQGTNVPCVFAGTLVHFYGSGLIDNYELVSIANPRNVTTLSGATGIHGLTTVAGVPGGLYLTGPVSITTASGTTTSNNVAFIQGQDSETGQGAQTIELAYNAGASSTYPINGSETSLRGLTSMDSATLCVTNGTHYATISVGTDSASNATNPIEVSVQQKGNTSCAGL